MTAPLRTEARFDGGVEHIVLDRPPGNVLDGELVDALRAHLDTLRERPSLRLIVFEGAGSHFSYGASVAEHLPDQVAAMLSRFHGFFRDLEALSVPTAAAVRGRCLGGGLELATWCGRVVCDPTATFAVPEVRLGVFPPVAALALRWRVGGAKAVDLICTGRAVTGEEAVAIGVADALAADPVAALDGWYHAQLAPLSAAGLRQAWRAARMPVARGLGDPLAALERAYLEDLMAHPDAEEGLRAFLEKRPPRWSDRSET